MGIHPLSVELTKVSHYRETPPPPKRLNSSIEKKTSLSHLQTYDLTFKFAEIFTHLFLDCSEISFGSV